MGSHCLEAQHLAANEILHFVQELVFGVKSTALCDSELQLLGSSTFKGGSSQAHFQSQCSLVLAPYLPHFTLLPPFPVLTALIPTSFCSAALSQMPSVLVPLSLLPLLLILFRKQAQPALSA